MPFDRHRVLGVPVDAVTEAETLQLVLERVTERRPTRIVTVNAEFVMRARADEAFRHAIETADLATPDGAGVLWALARQGVRLKRRVGGSDLVWSLSAQATRHGHRVFLLGGGVGVAAAAARRLQSEYGDLVVAGTWAGSPERSEEATIVDLIRRARADILFVAFGAPQQDLWIERNLEASGVCVALGVGGSLDYLAGTARRAPAWMQDSGLEWLWRLARQPWRWRRMLALPRFAWLVLRASPDRGERSERGGDDAASDD